MARGRVGKAEVARKHELFVRAYSETGDATAAAIAAGYSPKTARQIGSELLTKPDLALRAREMRDTKVQEQAAQFERQQRALRDEADNAIKTLAQVAQAAPRDDDGKADRAHHSGAMARVQAAVAILDRAGHKPVERVEQTVSWRDVTRELEVVDGADVLRNALREIAASEVAQPDHAE